MSKTYVDREELEKLFLKYNIPYTNIFDELHEHNAEEVTGNLSVHELREALDNKDEVFATQVWQKEDVYAALCAMEMQEADSEMIGRIMAEARAPLEDCSDNWEKLYNVVRSYRKGQGE